MDLISRAAAIDALTEYWQGISDRHPTLDGEMAVYADCKGIIKRLPSAQPEPKWIPCSERLPELNKEVLATDEDGFLYIAQLDLSRYTGNTYWEETTDYVSIEVVA